MKARGPQGPPPPEHVTRHAPAAILPNKGENMNDENELIIALEDLILVLEERVKPFALPPAFRSRVDSQIRVARRAIAKAQAQ